MARIRKIVRKNGTEVWQVRWIEGGSRGGKEANENFPDEPSAEAFKEAVDGCDQHWPPNWVKGVGIVIQEPEPEPAAPAPPVTVLDICYDHIDLLTGIEGRTRHDYKRMARLHFDPFFADMPAADCSDRDIARWVQWQEDGERDSEDPDVWARTPASPKSIANRHGLLSAAFDRVVHREAPLRTTNPCARTRLPRVDDEVDEEMVFLEHDEYQRIRAELALIHGGDVVDMTDVLVATGLRWGEVTALQPQDLNLNSSTPTLRVSRAWKRQADNSFLPGKPKSRKSRRTLRLSPGIVEILRRRIVGKKNGDWVFVTSLGNPWRHSNFRERRWLPAVKAAQKKGLTKSPRPHDLRHTHVAWLIAARIPPAAIQRRLGHESITTTMDRYGHLMRELDGQVAEAVEAAMSIDVAPVGHPRLVG